MKLRIQFSKEEPVRYISHLDLARVFERALRRAKIPVAMSEGFNPHIKVAYASALSVGVTSRCEYVDIELQGEGLPAEQIMAALRQQMPQGFGLVRCRVMPDHPAALMKIVNMTDFSMEVPLSGPVDPGWLQEQLTVFLQLTEIMVTRTSPKGSRTLDVRPLIKDLHIAACSAEQVRFALCTHIGEKGSVKPQEVLQAFVQLCGVPLQVETAVIEREGLWVFRDNNKLSPLDVVK